MQKHKIKQYFTKKIPPREVNTLLNMCNPKHNLFWAIHIIFFTYNFSITPKTLYGKSLKGDGNVGQILNREKAKV